MSREKKACFRRQLKESVKRHATVVLLVSGLLTGDNGCGRVSELLSDYGIHSLRMGTKKSRTQGPAFLFKKVHFYYKGFKPLPNIHAR